jgi:plasmid stability protein
VATLHVRNVPDDTYEALRHLAIERKSSIGAEAIRLLQRALRTDRAGARGLLDEIDASRPRARRGTPTAAALIRRDREAG